MTREEYTEFIADFKPVSDEGQFLFAEVDGEPVGICWGLPDWTALFRSFKGTDGTAANRALHAAPSASTVPACFSSGVLDSQRGKHIGQTPAATLYRYYKEGGRPRCTTSSTRTTSHADSPSRSAATAATSTPHTPNSSAESRSGEAVIGACGR